MEASRLWTPQPGPQLYAIEAKWISELFFGGARGGGKSDFLLGDFLQDVPTYGKYWRGIIFRNSYPELEELQQRAVQLFIPLGANYNVQKRQWIFPNAATFKFRFLESEKDADKYQGHQYTWIGFDELPKWPTPYAYLKLLACLRAAEIPIPTKRIRASGNPGGPGHVWVKQRFIDHAPLGYVPYIDPETTIGRMFIPSKVWDNKKLLENDPNYINMLKAVGSPELVRCWLEGDWNVALGAYFSRFGDQHILEPFKIPRSWPLFRSFDWGYAKPFSVGWWALCSGEQPQRCSRWIAKGALVRYREWYGASGPNKGLKMADQFIAQGINLRSGNEQYLRCPADPSIFARGDQSIAKEYRDRGIRWQKGDNDRINGWAQINMRLEDDGEGPNLYTFSTNTDFIKLFPALQHSQLRPEDVDTDGEDHLHDETRYMCMSRKHSAVYEKLKQMDVQAPTFNELMQQNRHTETVRDY